MKTTYHQATSTLVIVKRVKSTARAVGLVLGRCSHLSVESLLLLGPVEHGQIFQLNGPR